MPFGSDNGVVGLEIDADSLEADGCVVADTIELEVKGGAVYQSRPETSIYTYHSQTIMMAHISYFSGTT